MRANFIIKKKIFYRFKRYTREYTSNKLVKDNHTTLHYRNILLAVNVIISCVSIEIYRGLLSWPPRQAPLVQVISKCLIYTATHILFLICSYVIYYLYSQAKNTDLCINDGVIYCCLNISFIQENIDIISLGAFF